MDEAKVVILLKQLRKDLQTCQKIDDRMVAFFNSKTYFRTRDNLVQFAQRKLGYTLKLLPRAQMNSRLALVCTQQNLKVEHLLALLDRGQESKKVGSKRVKSSKASSNKRKVKTTKKVEDQGTKWVLLSKTALQEELNNLHKYPDSKTLKQAGYSLLKSEERRLRKREKIIAIILKRIEESQALAQFGS
jgi:hypothetical protein